MLEHLAVPESTKLYLADVGPLLLIDPCEREFI